MSSSLKTVILSAPQGWGKSLKAEQLRTEFGCTTVVDEWDPTQPVTKGALHLTHMPPAALLKEPHQADLVLRGW